MKKLTLISAIIALLLLPACAVNTAKVGHDGVTTTAQPSSSAWMDNAGRQVANYQGVAPTHLKQDAQGTWITTPGIGGVLTFDPASGQVYTWSPGDITVRNIKVTPQPQPGQPSFSAEVIESNKSGVATVYANQFKDAMVAIEGMTKAEAEARVKLLAETGKITGDVADVLIRAVIPLLP